MDRAFDKFCLFFNSIYIVLRLVKWLEKLYWYVSAKSGGGGYDCTTALRANRAIEGSGYLFFLMFAFVSF